MTDRDKRQKRVRIVVRRGALRRFDRLKREATDLPITLTWDRRQRERRVTAQSVKEEQRGRDRRKEPSFTWDLADFVVAEDDDEDEETRGG